MIRCGPEICTSLEAGSSREWLVTNGLGGFASSTVCGLNTRRYHGLLVAALHPPVGRMVMLSKLEETVIVNGRTYELGVNRYPGAVHPQGHRYLVEFYLDPTPVWVYRIEEVTVIKRLRMADGENSTCIEYESNAPIDLELRPLIAFRDYHSTVRENGTLSLPAYSHEDSTCIRIEPYDVPMFLHHPAQAEIEPTGHWYLNFEYEVERARGLDFREDLFQPFVLRFASTQHVRIIASAERRPADNAASPSGPFLVKRGDKKTILAGYHWFADWGRDAMIALPGLTLLKDARPEIARDILETFAQASNQGMLPNRFTDNANEAPEYNTADATLWMFEAVRLYLERTGDREFIQSRLLPKLVEIIDWHVRGTRYGIRVDPNDGLLSCGADGVQLTWMDAKVGDWVVTPRRGKPVEIQALWYNALCVMQQFRPRYEQLAAQCRASFRARFWNHSEGCLLDCIGDASIRPNQVFTLSLGYTMVPQQESLRILAVIERDLLTPMGLRTLSPRDPNYRGRYRGGVLERDGAYHQGTVWPWLLGPFLRAYVRAHDGSEAARAQARLWMQHLERHRVEEAGLGYVSEIADGDAPHRPGGCIAQAWSVAELLRAKEEIG